MSRAINIKDLRVKGLAEGYFKAISEISESQVDVLKKMEFNAKTCHICRYA